MSWEGVVVAAVIAAVALGVFAFGMLVVLVMVSVFGDDDPFRPGRRDEDG